MKSIHRILEQVDRFSCSKFSHVRSKPYLHHIILPSLSLSTFSDYAIVYLDFNGLNELNSEFAELDGDKAIENSLHFIEHHLIDHGYQPRLFRDGGDEFVCVVSGDHIQNLSHLLERISHQLHGLSFAKHEGLPPSYLSFCHGIAYANESSFPGDVYSKAEKREESHKLLHNLHLPATSIEPSTDKDDFFPALYRKARNGTHKFFTNFRFSDHGEFPFEKMKQIGLGIIDSASSLFSDPHYLDIVKKRCTSEDNSYHFTPIFHPEEAKVLDEYLTHTDTTSNLSELLPQLSRFLDCLIRSPVTGQYNRDYYENYFLPNILANPMVKQGKVSTMMYSLSGLKDSNQRIGHTATNPFLQDIAHQTKEKIESATAEPFDDMNFSINPYGSYFFDLGNGDFVAEHFYQEIDQETFLATTDISCPANSQLSIFADYLVSDVSALSSILPLLQKNISVNKFDYLLQFLDNPKKLQFAIEEFLAEDFDYYYQYHAKPNDIDSSKPFVDTLSSQQKFIEVIYRAFLEETYLTCERWKLKQKKQSSHMNDDDHLVL